MSECSIVAHDARSKRYVARVRRLTRRLFRLMRLRDVACEIILVGDREMKKNVLAYPAKKNFPRPDLSPRVRSLGEVYVNPHYIMRNGESIEYMVLHGILHLCGYRHSRKRDRMKMERRERFLFRRLGL